MSQPIMQHTADRSSEPATMESTTTAPNLGPNTQATTEADKDEAFLRDLQAAMGDSGIWSNFDPSSWRQIMAAKLARGSGSSSLAESNDNDNVYDSDDSAPMILNFNKLTVAEKAAPRTKGPGKLSKARQFASEETGFPQELAQLEQVRWKEPELERGAQSPEGDMFVAWQLVEGYPDMFVGKRNGLRAAPFFTVEALHENRVWDLYYVHCPPSLRMKPLILVPTYQFKHLLAVINAKLETALTIPPGRNESRFLMVFGAGNSPRPRFLGRSNSPESFKALCDAVPAPHPDDDLARATGFGQAEFKQFIMQSRADRKKGKKADKNRTKRIQAHQAFGREVKRVQRYLGLRGRATEDAPVATALDLSKPMTDRPENSVLFVAIDIEAWEMDQNLVTEVGIAMLDTKEIRHVAPGDGGKNWFEHIRARHIRVRENTWAVNTRYVHGCADYFNFGTSELVSKSLLAPLIQFHIDHATATDPADGTAVPRPVVLVFHESSSDIKYLRLLSYHVEAAGNVVEIVDTREMHQSLARSNDSASLASVLARLGIEYTHLHNAGNDAVYTLQAMVGLAVEKRGASIERARMKREGEDPLPFSEVQKNDGWTSGEDTDGGEPAGLAEARSSWGIEVTRGQSWWC